VAAIDKMDRDALEEAIADIDKQVGEHGKVIAQERKATRTLLSKKDDLVNALNDRIRATGPNMTLGDDRG
jgi:uncharacterized coiled-coil protein SlyX